MRRKKLAPGSSELHDRLTLRMPLLGSHNREPENGATIISIAPLDDRRDGLIPWLEKLVPFTRDYVPKVPKPKDEEKRGLWIRIYRPETAHLLKLPDTRHKELGMALGAILNNIVAVAENHNPISLVPVAEHCHERLDILTFVDIPHLPESPYSSAFTDIAIRLLPAMLRQLRSKYTWILIDLPEFWYPHVQTIVEISTHWLIPYEVANTNMIDKIFSIKKFFMSLRKSGAPFDCSGIIPIFTGRDPRTYAQDLVKLEEIFGPRLWPMPPDNTGLSEETLDVFYEPSLIKFYKLTGDTKYGVKKLELFDRAFILLSLPHGYLDKTLLDQLKDYGPYLQLSHLLSQRTELSKGQQERIRSVNYSTMLTVMQYIYNSTYEISIDYILAALEIESDENRSMNLVAVVQASDPSVVTMGNLMGIEPKNAGHYFFKLWLTKHLTLEFCKKEMGYV